MDVCKQSSDAGRAAIKTEHLHAPSSAASASSTVSNSSSIDPRIKLQQQQIHQQQIQQNHQQQQIQQQQIITQNPIQSSQNHPPLQMQSQTHQTNMLSQDQARLLPQQHPAITVADPIPVQAPIPVQTQSGLPMAGHKRSAAVAFAQHADGQRPPPSMPIPTPLPTTLPTPLPIPIPIPTLAPTLSSLGQSVALPVQSCSSAGNSNTNYSSTGSNNSDEPIPQSQSNDLNQQPLTQQQQQQQQQNPQQHPSHPTTAKIPSRLAPLNRSGKNLSEKKIRRLEKNRLSARNCRKKKKEYTQNLQTEIMILEGDNLRLRLQLQIGQEAEQSSVKEQERVTEQIDDLLKSGASDPEIYNSIEMFKEKFADYGRDRRSAIEFHLRNAERLLMPTTTTSIAMRALEGGSRLSSGTSSTVNNDESGDDDNDDDNDNDDMGDDDGDNDGMGDVDVNIDFNEVVNDLPSSGAALDQGQDGKPSSSFIAMPVSVPVPMEKDTAVGTHAGDGDGMGTETPAIPTPISQTPAMNTTATSPSGSAQITSQDGSPKPRKTLQLKNTEPKELFAYLVKFLQVTPEQSAALKDSRHVASELDSALEKSLAMLGELRERLTDMGQNLDAEFSAIRLILTPTQTAKFLVWVANNGACMHMLNELWSKVYPEPVSNDADDDDNDGIDDDDNDIDDGDDDDGDDGEDDNDIDNDDDDDDIDDDDGDDGEEKEITSSNE